MPCIRMTTDAVFKVVIDGEEQDVIFEHGCFYDVEKIEECDGYCDIQFKNGIVAKGVARDTFFNCNVNIEQKEKPKPEPVFEEVEPIVFKRKNK